MIGRFFDWCGRNIELIVWFNIVLLSVSAWQQAVEDNFYPLGLCALLIGLVYILKK